MAKYHYICKNCGFEEDVEHPMSECDNPRYCIECGLENERVPVRTSFILKGMGWAGQSYDRIPTRTGAGE